MNINAIILRTLVFILAFFSCIDIHAQTWIHHFDFPQSKDCPREVMAAIEIPFGSYIKYEIDKATGHILVDRFQSVPMFYPANYGVLSQTLAGDGDNLDVLVYTRLPLQSGALITVRPIGILRMIDGGEQDDKVIAVPTNAVDPTYADIRSTDDLPAIERERLEFFFRTYKQLPAGRKKVELRGLHSVEAAQIEILSAVTAYAKAKRLDQVPCRAQVRKN